MYEIKNRWTGDVLYRSETAESLRESLNEAIKAGVNLSGANLSGANLSGANLSVANLSGANLSVANLSGANLSWTNLSGANLSGVNLSRANLSGVNLLRADLLRADLSWANLSGADLSWADLSWANLSWANLSGADLSWAKNVPAVDPMPTLKADILGRVEGDPGALDMSDWHTCETTHCLAGWATTLHPQGRLLESLIGVNAAAALIFHVSAGEIPDFYQRDESAVKWLRKPAKVVAAGASGGTAGDGVAALRVEGGGWHHSDAD